MKVYCQSVLILSTRNSSLSFEVVSVVYLSFVDVAQGKNQAFNHVPSAAGLCGGKVLWTGMNETRNWRNVCAAKAAAHALTVSCCSF